MAELSADASLEREGSLWELSPAEWFATFQDSSLGKTLEDAASAIGPLPESLGRVSGRADFTAWESCARVESSILVWRSPHSTSADCVQQPCSCSKCAAPQLGDIAQEMRHAVTQVVVNGMRVRIKLDEERLADLLKGMDTSNVPGLLKHLGDVASLSFVPHQNGAHAGSVWCRNLASLSTCAFSSVWWCRGDWTAGVHDPLGKQRRSQPVCGGRVSGLQVGGRHLSWPPPEDCTGPRASHHAHTQQ